MNVRDSIYKPLETSPDSVFQPEQHLWISVVMQAVIDAASGHKKIKRGVVLWVASEAFEDVCDMAGMSAPYVASEINKVISASTKEAAFKRAMAFRFLVRSYIESNMGSAEGVIGRD